jgi:hypothetical protein
MAATTASIPVRRRELSTAAALLLTIGGNVLVVAIAALGVIGVGVAAAVVFGSELLAAL